MADPLSLAASITGVLAFAAATARSLATIVQEIRDAPDDIVATGRDVRALAAVLSAAHDTCTRHNLAAEDKDLAAALAEYVDMCQEAMQGLRIILRPLAAGARPIRLILGWAMKKGEVRALRARLNEGKASLNLTLSALNGVLEGKGQEDIKKDIAKSFEQMMHEFRSLGVGKKVKKRIEDDAVSVSISKGRRSSISQTTDSTFVMRRFLEPADGDGKGNPFDDANHPSTPWASDPDLILGAVRNRDKHLINSLLAEKGSLSSRSAQGYTVLHYCAINNDAGTAALLIEHGADINAKDYELRSPFQVALASEALDVARLLAERGCTFGDLSSSLLPLMAREEEVPGIPSLLAALAERLNQARQGPHLIHDAITLNERDALKMLLASGFSATKPDRDGLSPFHLALRTQRQPLIKLLLDHGASANEILPRAVFETVGIPSSWHMTSFYDEETSFTPLQIAARYIRSESLTTFLLENGADPNQRFGASGQSVVLAGLCAEEYIKEAKAIVHAGADPNIAPPDGRGPMYWATVCENHELMRCLLAHGGDVNHAVDDGSTLIIFAASGGDAAMVRILLEAGADPGRRDDDGYCAADYAMGGGHGEVLALLGEGEEESGEESEGEDEEEVDDEKANGEKANDEKINDQKVSDGGKVKDDNVNDQKV